MSNGEHVNSSAIKLFTESLSDFQIAAIDHSAKQQAQRAVTALPPSLRDGLNTEHFQHNIRSGILEDLYLGKTDLQAYAQDYEKYLENERGMPSAGSRNGSVAR